MYMRGFDAKLKTILTAIQGRNMFLRWGAKHATVAETGEGNYANCLSQQLSGVHVNFAYLKVRRGSTLVITCQHVM